MLNLKVVKLLIFIGGVSVFFLRRYYGLLVLAVVLYFYVSSGLHGRIMDKINVFLGVNNVYQKNVKARGKFMKRFGKKLFSGGEV